MGQFDSSKTQNKPNPISSYKSVTGSVMLDNSRVWASNYA